MKFSKGFTLIELLVVIGILSILVVGLIAALNPAEQLKRAGDARRKSNVAGLGKALEEYYITNGSYPPANSSWMQTLVTGGQLKSLTPQVSGTANCWLDTSRNSVNNYCYYFFGSNVVVWTNAESRDEISGCGSGSHNPPDTYLAYDSSVGRVCLKCNWTPGGAGTCFD